MEEQAAAEAKVLEAEARRRQAPVKPLDEGARAYLAAVVDLVDAEAVRLETVEDRRRRGRPRVRPGAGSPRPRLSSASTASPRRPTKTSLATTALLPACFPSSSPVPLATDW